MQPETVRVESPDGEKMECRGCFDQVELRQVAGFLRSAPNADFSPWCPKCMFSIIHAAFVGYEEMDGMDDA